MKDDILRKNLECELKKMDIVINFSFQLIFAGNGVRSIGGRTGRYNTVS